MTLIQRFGSARNLDVHFHLLVLDGVYGREGEGKLRFVPGTRAAAKKPGESGEVTSQLRLNGSPDLPSFARF